MTPEKFKQWVMGLQRGEEIKHQMNEPVKEERILNARIEFERIVDHPADKWQNRYCTAIDVVAKRHNVAQDELSSAYFKHMGPSIVSDNLQNKNEDDDGDDSHIPPTDNKQITEQMRTNFYWLLEQMDKIHDALCPEQNGAWQQRAEQAVEAAKLIHFNLNALGFK